MNKKQTKNKKQNDKKLFLTNLMFWGVAVSDKKK